MACTIKLRDPEFTGDGYYCHSRDKVLILDGRYDPDQYWLDICETVIFRPPSPEPQPLPGTGKKPTTDSPLRPSDFDLVPYFPEHGVEQYPLPMSAWQIPSRSMAKRIRKAEYPCFERDTDKKLFSARYNNRVNAVRTNEEFRTWVKDHCIGRVLADKVIVFEKEQDYVMALISGKFSKHAH